MNNEGKWSLIFLPGKKKNKKKSYIIQNKKSIIQIEIALQLAIFKNLNVEIKYFSKRNFLTEKGKITKIDLCKKTVLLDSKKEISLNNILLVYLE